MARLFIEISVWGCSSPSFAFTSFSVSSYNGKASESRPAASYVPARLFLAPRVSGWSGPNFVFISFSVSSNRGRASARRPAADRYAKARLFIEVSVWG